MARPGTRTPSGRSGPPTTTRSSNLNGVPGPTSTTSQTAASWITIGDGSLTVDIVARPGASRRRIVRIDPHGLVIALNSAPEKGKANDELIEFLSRELKVPRSSLQVVRGETSRRKTIRISPCDPSAIASRLAIMTVPEL